jgi:shikimate kinase
MIGSGKTPIGQRLAERIGWPFFDLDREMNQTIGRSFHELVREQGWLPFREIEYGICKRFSKMERIVFALGGGTIRYEWNRDVLRGTGVIILLEANVDTLIERVRLADRPRVNPGVSMEEDIRRMWAQFAHLYRGAADLIYRTDQGKNIEEEVEEIQALLNARGFFESQRPSFH